MACFKLLIIAIALGFGGGACDHVKAFTVTTIGRSNWSILLTPRPPNEPPIDMENNPAVIWTPRPPIEPPTDMENNPACRAFTSAEITSGPSTSHSSVPSSAFFFLSQTDAPIEETKENFRNELFMEESSSEQSLVEETEGDDYNALGLLAESVGKVAFGGSKAAIFGLKAFVDIVSAPK